MKKSHLIYPCGTCSIFYAFAFLNTFFFPYFEGFSVFQGKLAVMTSLPVGKKLHERQPSCLKNKQ